MSDRILVAYASRGGSTAGVAEAIGQTLAAGGAEVDVRSMTEIDDVTAYQAVVAGSAIQAHQWLPEAMQFIQAHQAELPAPLAHRHAERRNESWRLQALRRCQALPERGRGRPLGVRSFEPGTLVQQSWREQASRDLRAGQPGG